MQGTVEALLIVAGIAGLWIGTEVAVRAGGEIGRRLGISELVLGLTVFAIGTDVSELVVSIQGSLHRLEGADTAGLIVGNAIGSVLAQGGVVLGVVALADAFQRAAADRTALRDAAAWLLATLLLGTVAADGKIGRDEGLAMVAIYVVWVTLVIRNRRRIVDLDAPPRDTRAIARLALLLVGGLAMVVFAADVVVQHTMAFAERSGIPPTAIGLFGIAIGTSLPELAVSIGAIARGRPVLSIGNVLGSNVFDLLVPIGVAAAIEPLPVSTQAVRFDLTAAGVLALYFTIRLAVTGRLAFPDAARVFGLYLAYLLFRIGTFAA